MDINNDELFDAVRNGNVKYIKSQLMSGLDPNYEWNGWTLLKFAIEHEKKDVIGLLLENGADINREEWTALHHAVDTSIDGTLQTEGKLGNEPTDIIKLLMDKRANVNIKDNNGCTPIDIAREYGSIKIVRFFEEYCRNNKGEMETI